MSPKDVLTFAKEKGTRIVDLRFIDLPGLWQHFSIPISELNEEVFEEGLGFDGSSIRGFQRIHESDMLLLPDPDTAFLDPACNIPTLAIICDVISPGSISRERTTPSTGAASAASASCWRKYESWASLPRNWASA